MSQYPIKWITDNLAVGYAPMSYTELDDIKALGIDAIVNLCAEFSDLHDLEASSGFEVYYLPIWDEDIPKMEDMEKALSWLDEAIYLGKKVLVHCRHGIGRTGTFVSSYMIRKGLSLKAASKKLKFSNANPSNYGQWKLLKKYGKKSGTLKIREPSLEIKNRVDLSLFFSDYEALIKNIDKEIQRQQDDAYIQCGKAEHNCCGEGFDIQLIEVLYLHYKMNRHFTSAQREVLIKRAVETYKKERLLCPFNGGQGCEVYDIRPARCRIYGALEFSADKNEIQDMLFELSQTLFLAFSGKFLPDIDFRFSMADTISGKFVQKYFHYMADIEKK
ncbi:MAG: dual specificity protein phosphatase family protein [Deltaproteobacteria bacterium]|uniref:phosphatase domain-containing putative toxin n=1 Tax=Desulfobacula sp. TaxID=2593537 RepID=UPI0019CB9E45|nr:dual specificity protein phosphatase family protein [Candidatus Desulfobacula maris]MBL6992855.1 dual specificity protein phosphatase family protein [Desulfobacula sp.]